jgi:hypothetical protein
MIKKLKSKIKAWWRRNIVAPVPPGQEDMFDEWNPNGNRKIAISIEGILEEAKKDNMHREIDLYAKRVIHVNDGIDHLYAYQLAYEEFYTRKDLIKAGYTKTQASILAGNLRYGIY